MQRRWTSIFLSLEEKYCSVCKPVSAMTQGGYGEGGKLRGRTGEKKMLKPKHQGNTNISNSTQPKKKVTEIPKMYCSPTLKKKFSGPRVSSLSYFFAAASFTHLLLSGSFTGQRWPAWRPKELPLIDLVCFLPKFIFCSSCHKDSPVRRMCLERSVTSLDIMVSALQYSHSKLVSDSREQVWISCAKHSKLSCAQVKGEHSLPVSFEEIWTRGGTQPSKNFFHS